MKRQPIAFMSYVRRQDAHDDGRVTEFRARLSAEVHMQTGEEFPIFQDRNDIQWGQYWKERIDKSVDDVTFFIPIITPGFFSSPACCDELKRFLRHEKKLRRNDLILPVYYVDFPLLNDEAKRKGNRLAQAIAARQYADWRDLRFEPFTDPTVGKRLEQMAVQIRDALERVRPSRQRPSRATRRRAPKPSPPRAVRGRAATDSLTPPQVAESAIESGMAKGRLAAKTEPPTRVVDPMGRGTDTTISEAIKAANPGERILVRPGLYKEGLLLDKPLEIIGEGSSDDVVIEATGRSAMLFKTTLGRVANLTLRQMGGGRWFGVDIAQGRLELEGCDITSQSLACIAIHGGANPVLRRNRIHDSKSAGIFVYENGKGTVEDNEIFGNALAGVGIEAGGNPTLRRNRIHDGKQGGVFVYGNGQGTLEDNDIFGNALAGVTIKTGGNPTLRRNRIHDGKQGGVLVNENGQGTLEDNDIFGNTYAGVEIKTGGNPTLRRNRIHDGKVGGVFVNENGQGTLEDNDIFGNTYAGVQIQVGGNPRCAAIVSIRTASKLCGSGKRVAVQLRTTTCAAMQEARGTFPPIASRMSDALATRSDTRPPRRWRCWSRLLPRAGASRVLKKAWNHRSLTVAARSVVAATEPRA